METTSVSTTNGATAEAPEVLPPLTPEHPACAFIRLVDGLVGEIDAAKRIAGMGGPLPDLGGIGRDLMEIHETLSIRPDWIPNRYPDPLPGLRAFLRWSAEFLADAIRDANADGSNAERLLDASAFNATRASNALSSIYQRGDRR